MRKLAKIITIISIILILSMTLLTTSAWASGIIDPSDFTPEDLQQTDVKTVTDKASPIIEYIRVIGVIITSVSLIIIGIKYMVGSVEEKADYKKSLMQYVIGVFVFFAITQILTIIIEFVGQFE